MPKISIIVPLYNAEQFLDKCINSILDQSFKDFECILVNDGSTDQSERICKKYEKEDLRIRYIVKENGGVSTARNAGLDAALGEFVNFVDADDWLDKQYLDVLLHTQEKQDADLTICEFSNIKEKGKSEQRSVFPEDFFMVNGEAYEIVLEKILWNHRKQRLSVPYCKLYRRRIIEHFHIRFSEKVPLGEDTLFNLTYLQYIKRFSYLHKSLYNRLIHTESAINKFHPDIFDNMGNFYQEYSELKTKYAWSSKAEIHFVMQGLIANIIRFYFAQDDYKKSGHEMNREYYEFLNQPLIRKLWKEVHLSDCADWKEFINVFCVKTHLFHLLVRLYKCRK